MKRLFSVEAALSLYNEGLRQVELELRESPELAVGKITARKSVARTRLVKTEDTSVCNSEL
jgi:hypothetical protein